MPFIILNVLEHINQNIQINGKPAVTLTMNVPHNFLMGIFQPHYLHRHKQKPREPDL